MHKILGDSFRCVAIEIYFGTKVKIATERFDNGTLSALNFPFGGLSLGKLSLNSNTDNSDPIASLVKLAVMSTSVGLRATKYPGMPDLMLWRKTICAIRNQFNFSKLSFLLLTEIYSKC